MTVTDTIQIDAAPDVVWDVTVDVERWPAWTPTVTAVRLIGARELGAGSVARIRQPMQPQSEWVVTAFDPGRRFVWETRRIGLRMAASHDLEPQRRRDAERPHGGGHRPTGAGARARPAPGHGQGAGRRESRSEDALRGGPV